jgi:hypothetical protein
MTDSKIGKIVLQSKDGVVRLGVIAQRRLDEDGWAHYNIQWIGRGLKEAEWLRQTEWRCDKVRILDEKLHLSELQDAIKLSTARKFKEGT